MEKIRVLYATGNSMKQDELRTFLEVNPEYNEFFNVEYGSVESETEFIEGNVSYAANALSKAKHYTEFIDSEMKIDAIICDDMGIAIPVMQMRPGVMSKRFAGEGSKYALKIGRIIDYLRHFPTDYRAGKDVSVNSDGEGYIVHYTTSLGFIDFVHDAKSYTVTTSNECMISKSDVRDRFDLRKIDEKEFYNNILTHKDIPEFKHFSELTLREKFPYNPKNKAFGKVFNILLKNYDLKPIKYNWKEVENG